MRELQAHIEAITLSASTRGTSVADLLSRIAALEAEREAALAREEDVLAKLVLLEKERRCKAAERGAESQRIEVLRQERDAVIGREETMKARLARLEEEREIILKREEDILKREKDTERTRMRELGSERLAMLEREREMTLKREEDMLAKLLQLEVVAIYCRMSMHKLACVLNSHAAACMHRRAARHTSDFDACQRESRDKAAELVLLEVCVLPYVARSLALPLPPPLHEHKHRACSQHAGHAGHACFRTVSHGLRQAALTHDQLARGKVVRDQPRGRRRKLRNRLPARSFSRCANAYTCWLRISTLRLSTTRALALTIHARNADYPEHRFCACYPQNAQSVHCHRLRCHGCTPPFPSLSPATVSGAFTDSLLTQDYDRMCRLRDQLEAALTSLSGELRTQGISSMFVHVQTR